jgi:hypothetical protein
VSLSQRLEQLHDIMISRTQLSRTCATSWTPHPTARPKSRTPC